MKQQFTILMIIAFAVGVLAPAAHAGLILALDDLGTPGLDALIVDDAVLGTLTKLGSSNTLDSFPGVGIVNFMGPLGVFNINVTTTISKPVIGGPMEAILELNSVNVSGGAGMLRIMATDTDYLLATQPDMHTLTSMIGGVTDGTVTLEQILDLADNQFAIGPPSPNPVTLGLQGPFGPDAFTNTASVDFLLGSDRFSLTEVVTIVHTGGFDITSFDVESSVALVPVPAAVILGILGLGVAGLKLRKYA